MVDPKDVRWGEVGLVPGIVQDANDGRVLMLGYLDEEALAATARTGEVHFHSRSRGRLWRKGETSGNVLRMKSVALDCDGDALLLTVEPAGSYTADLLNRGIDAVARKVTEEATEVLIAAKDDAAAELSDADRDATRAALAGESADLLYHLLVLLASRDTPPSQVIGALRNRAR
jgi:phosphoribosyl-ATP pyrophosphohydrolase/phosphoribosyl-AMP cyclohydrolase